MTIQLVVFIVLALIAISAALGMISSRNSVYAALLLIVNFCAIAVLYLTLNAPFIAVAQVAVYAGAIMVLFLFVIMLLGAEQLPANNKVLPWQRPAALTLGVLLIAETVFIFVTRLDWQGPNNTLPTDFGSPEAVGQLLFSKYVLPFEITSILLLAAMVGAIILTRFSRDTEGAS